MWRIGIDEAGYGPNLGPLVMSAVACQVPDELADANLWQVLSKSVRRRRDGKRLSRLLVDDSKLVYSTDRGLADLELSVLSLLSRQFQAATTLAALVDGLHPDHDLRREAWFQGATVVPLETEAAAIAAAGDGFYTACDAASIEWRFCQSVIVSPPRFNGLIDRFGTKAAALGVGVVQLLQTALTLPSDEDVVVFVDKHGGRNNYAALLCEAFPDCWVLPREEGMDRSVYDIKGWDQPVRVQFQPRADSEHFEVALASMISKYLREALMVEFNAFWRQHVPDLQPTAGYPGDATRFFDAIRPALTRLKIAEELVWRKR